MEALLKLARMFLATMSLSIRGRRQMSKTAISTISNLFDRYLPPHAWLISSRLLLSCIPRTFRTHTWAMTWGGQGQSSEGKVGRGGEEEDEVLGPGAEEE